MVLYRSLRAINHAYPLAVLWLYVGALVVAMALMFVFPPGTLLLLWMGLVGLAGVLVAARLLAGAQRLAARMNLDAGACPSCGQRMQTTRDTSAAWQCEACHHTFLPSGAESGPA